MKNIACLLVLFSLWSLRVNSQTFDSKNKLRKFYRNEFDIIYCETYYYDEYSSGGIGYEFGIFEKWRKKNAFLTLRNELLFIGPPHFTFSLEDKFINSFINFNFQKDYLIYKIGLGGRVLSSSYTFTPSLNMGINFDNPKRKIVFGLQFQTNFDIYAKGDSVNIIYAPRQKVATRFWFYTFGVNVGRYF